MEVRDRFSGIHGTVAEKFVPAEGLEAAMEAALGEMSGFMICDSRSNAEEVINYLKTQGRGKVGILVPDSGTLNPVVKRPDIPIESFLGWLDSSVNTEEGLKPLMQAVLSRTAVFKANTDPSEILGRLPYGFSAVSTDGVLYSQNIITGGADEKFPLFRREEKLAEQDRLIIEISEKQESVQKNKDHNNANIAEARAESTRLSDQLESFNDDVNEAIQKHKETEYRLGTIDNELSRLSRERSDHSNKLEKLRSQQYSLGLDFGQLADEKQKLVDNMSKASTDLDTLECNAGHAMEKVSRLQVEIVESRSKIEQIETKISHLAELKLEIESGVDAKQNEIERAHTEIATADETVVTLEYDLKSVFRTREEATERQQRTRALQSEVMARVSKREEHLKVVRTQKDTVSDQIHQYEMRINTFDSEIGSIRQRILDEYEVDIDTVEATRPDDKLDDEDAKAYLVDHKERLKNFGAVNLLALEEFSKASERESFLKEQIDDLTTAKDDLKKTISKINQTARQLFLETFGKAKVNFKKLFVDLFTGGEADIYLEDPSDPLESDIMIIARPRGKKLLSITMMSGGERALTSIALLFALYLVKPSPFCILDEIDAPLDDANCRRFLNIIRNFSIQTQFIVITHNKITMEAAENLYGITMEQPGVSQLVAVKFSDVDQDEQTGRLIINNPEDDDETGSDYTEPVVPVTEEQSLPDNVAERMQSDLTIADETNRDD
jgi:chromosome segregation protein